MTKPVIILAFCVMTSLGAAPGVKAQNLQLVQSSQLFGNQDASQMQIDILPGSKENVINSRAGRTIQIAILGSDLLDVNSINPRTIRLNGVEVMLVGKSDKSLCRQTDVDGDGFLDLLCDVRTTGFRVEPGTYDIMIQAETYDKASLRGQDRLKIVRN